MYGGLTKERISDARSFLLDVSMHHSNRIPFFQKENITHTMNKSIKSRRAKPDLDVNPVSGTRQSTF